MVYTLNQLMLHALGAIPAVQRVRTTSGLQALENALLADRSRGLNVDTFEVQMVFEGVALDFGLLRRCLELMPRLTDLTLQLPFRLPGMRSQLNTLLAGIELPSLQLLKTNLPHSAVACCLQHVPNIKHLTFLILEGDCASDGVCALRNIDLPRLMTIECSTGCLRHIYSANIDRLTLHNNTPLIFTSVALHRATPFANLTNLTLQFFSGDYDILDKVVAFAPNIRKLRLIELVTYARNGKVPARRVWKASKLMASSLKKLPLLEEFMLDSVSDVVNRKGPISRVRQEEELIHGWLTGRRQTWQKASSRIKYHPSLYRISLFYGRHAPSTQVLSTWSRNNTRWERIVDQEGFMADVVL